MACLRQLNKEKMFLGRPFYKNKVSAPLSDMLVSLFPEPVATVNLFKREKIQMAKTFETKRDTLISNK